MDFVSRFTERIGSRTSREVARKKKKGGKRNKRGTKKKEEAGGGGGVTREKKETARRTRGKYGYFSIVIHRARISNYNDGWEKGPARPGYLCSPVRKIRRTRTWLSSMVAARLPVFSARGSSGAMIYHRLPIRAPRRNYSFSETWTDDTFTSSSISNCRTGISCR